MAHGPSHGPKARSRKPVKPITPKKPYLKEGENAPEARKDVEFSVGLLLIGDLLVPLELLATGTGRACLEAERWLRRGLSQRGGWKVPASVGLKICHVARNGLTS